MNKLNLGITFPVKKDVHQILYVNGIVQNCKFFYDLFQLLGHDPCFLTTKPVPGQLLTIGNKSYRALSYQEIDEQRIKLDIAFDPGITIIPQDAAILKRHADTRIVSVRYGPSLVIDMEQLFIRGPMERDDSKTGRLHVNEADYVWTSPHYEYSTTYLETIYNCPVRICPYIWEPDFVTDRFGGHDYLHKPDIYTMEPNLSVVKNALIPLAIIEQIYRVEPDAFGRATILNGKRFSNSKYFLENMVRNMSSMINIANKVYFTGRYTFDQVFKRPDILLGHQWKNELNYLYFEALYKGVPVVHNSASMQEVGYYYPEFDVLAGKDQCLVAIHDFKNTAKQQKKNDSFIARFSITNPENAIRYKELISEIMC